VAMAALSLPTGKSSVLPHACEDVCSLGACTSGSENWAPQPAVLRDDFGTSTIYSLTAAQPSRVKACNWGLSSVGNILGSTYRLRVCLRIKDEFNAVSSGDW